MPEIVLASCSPVPLASYLKALGVFRLVAEQKDKDVRGFWRDEAFVLETSLSKGDLICFFLQDYSPSPIISPWNGRAGFLEGEDAEESTRSGAELLRRFQQSTAPKFERIRLVLGQLRRIPSITLLNSIRAERKKEEARQSAIKRRNEGLSNHDRERLNALRRQEKTAKDALVGELRSSVPDELIEWVDACVRVGTLIGSAPLLGSGGNDGSRDLGVNFGQKIGDVFNIDHPQGAAKATAVAVLKAALFAAAAIGLKRDAMGQFAPGQAGPNSSTGFGAESPLNPWDTILALEGAIMFSGSATRRLGTQDRGGASFPFTVAATGAAGAGAIIEDESESRGEVWVPLWHGPASFEEIHSLLSEGRATLGRRNVRDGLDFGRAITSLGISRGVASFQRYGLVKREGRSYIAAPMSRFRVEQNPLTDLLIDLDNGRWVSRFREEVRLSRASARLRAIGRDLDEAIFAATQQKTPQSVQRVLIAIGDIAAYLASAPKTRDPKDGNQRPPPRLSRAWFEAANDGTAEFRIAAALAGLGREPQQAAEAEPDQEAVATEGEAEPAAEDDASGVEDEAAAQAPEPDENRARKVPPPPFCAHLAPLDEKSWYARRRAWGERDRLAVWGAGSLQHNLISVLERRLLFATQRNLVGGPFDGRASADLVSVLAFLDGDTDDAKIAALARGLAWADPPNQIRTEPADLPPLPLAYALLKPLFASADQVREAVGKQAAMPEGASLSVPPGLVSRLSAGDFRAAVTLACQRARGSGLPVTFAPSAEHVVRGDGERLLAALLIPIRTVDLKRVLQRAHPALFDDTEAAEMEETADAA